MPSVGNADPLVLRIVEEVGNDHVVAHTIRRSAPRTILDRSTMWVGDVISTGVLVAGPGALDATRRRERSARLAELLLYAAARVSPACQDGDVHFDGQELVAIVAADENVSPDQARAMLRDALGTLGGREITSAYVKREIGYVIPASAINHLPRTKRAASGSEKAPRRPPRPGGRPRWGG